MKRQKVRSKMGGKEKALTAASSIASGDFLRMVTSAGAARKIDYSKLAKAIVEEYNGSTIAGSAQTLKAALDSLNSNSIKRTDNIFVRANTEDTVDLPFSNGDSNAVFLLSIGNTYGAGGVWCILPKSSSESMKITPLIPSEYFVLEGIGYDKIKVTALSASGNVQIINLNS